MARQTLTVQLMHANARIAKLEEQLLDVTSAYSVLSTKYDAISAQQPGTTVRDAKPQPEAFNAYWDYVHAAKKWCYANNKPVSYASTEQFVEAHAYA